MDYLLVESGAIFLIVVLLCFTISALPFTDACNDAAPLVADEDVFPVLLSS